MRENIKKKLNSPSKIDHAIENEHKENQRENKLCQCILGRTWETARCSYVTE